MSIPYILGLVAPPILAAALAVCGLFAGSGWPLLAAVLLFGYGALGYGQPGEWR